MSKHTPGPWEIDTRHGLAVGPCRIRMSDSPTAASMAAKMADARLIAAAPDLLAACHAIFDHYDETDLMTGDIETLRAAIAKAEGAS
jgi:hypothetical protein